MKKIFAAVVGLFVIFLITFSQTKFWRSGDKLSLSVGDGGGGVSVITFDSKGETITTVTIPGDTQVEVSRGLGTFRLKSVWELGVNEKAEGALTSETVTKNFEFPSYTWVDARADLSSPFKTLFSPYKTNLGIGDKIQIALFSLGVKNAGRVNIDLRETSYLKKMILKDGEEGFIVTGSIPQNLSVIFADPEVSSKNFKVIIRDSTQKAGIAREIGEIVEVLGPKVASITKENLGDIDCEVSGKDARFSSKVALVFGCKVVGGKLEGNFDLEIKLGEKFAKRF